MSLVENIFTHLQLFRIAGIYVNKISLNARIEERE